MFRMTFKRMANIAPMILRRGVGQSAGCATTRSVLRALGKTAGYVAVGSIVGAVAREVYKSNVKEKVSDHSVLEDVDSKQLNVVDFHKLKYVKDTIETGRSGARLVQDDQGKMYYLKSTFNRKYLLNELFAGALGRWLLGDKAPAVYLVENNKGNHQAEFMFMSESLGDCNVNMEDWAKAGSAVDPKHLGVFLALNFFIGDSDTKLANLVIIMSGDRKGHCYCIDHEKAFELNVKTLNDAELALQKIGEFHMEKSLSDRLLEQEEGAGLDVNRDNLQQPLKGDDRIKNIIRPKLLAHIQEDIDDGCVQKLYAGILSLSKVDLENMIRPFGSFIHANEKAEFIDRVLERQAALKALLAKQHQSETQRPRL